MEWPCSYQHEWRPERNPLWTLLYSASAIKNAWVTLCTSRTTPRSLLCSSAVARCQPTIPSPRVSTSQNSPLLFSFFPSLEQRVYVCRGRGEGASGGEGKAARGNAMRCDVMRYHAKRRSTTPSPWAPGWRGASTLCCSATALLPTALGTVTSAPSPQYVPRDDAPGTPVWPCTGVQLFGEHRLHQ